MPSRISNLAGFSTSILTTNSLVLGTGTSTGTTNQNLQVTGGAYVSGNIGVGTTRPIQPLSVIGNTYVSGNIGVGTTRPTSTLHVVGNTYVSGNIGVGTTNPTSTLHVVGIASTSITTILQGNTLVTPKFEIADVINSGVSTFVRYAVDLSPTSGTTIAEILHLSHNGKFLYSKRNTTANIITQYSLSTPWDISPSNVGVGTTFSIIGGNPTFEDVYVSPAGNYGFVLQDTGRIYAYSLSTPYDFTSRVSLGNSDFTVTSPTAFTFKPDGTKLYSIDTINDSISQFSLSSPWNVLTGITAEKSSNITIASPAPRSLSFSYDGTKLIAADSTNGVIYQYSLATPWDVGTVSFASSISTSSFDAAPYATYLSPDQSRLYVSGSVNDRFYQFNNSSSPTKTSITGELEVASNTNLYGTLKVSGQSLFDNFVGIGTTNPTSTLQVTGGDSRFGGVIETVSTATTYMSGTSMVLEMDVRQSTTYTYTIPTGANIGIVSFRNMPAQTGRSSGTTLTLIATQNSAGTGNTTATTGIGTNITVIGYENGAAVAGISTRALVGSGTTVTLSTTGNDRDFVSFFINYTGATNTTASSYQVYATKNGGFR